MYDPDRDEEPRGTFGRRIMVISLITIAFAVALWPAISGFHGGPNQDSACVAVLDGWHADRTVSDEQLARELTAEEVARANADIDWREGAGACVPEARHRLIVSGSLVTAIAVALGAASIFFRRRGSAARLQPLDDGRDATMLVG